MKKSWLRRLLAALLAATTMTALAASGLLLRADNALCDALYLREDAPHEDIVLVGIDQRALEEFGPFPWTRDVLAQAIAALNADPDCRPAVIGVDVLFVGESDAQADALLAEAASAGNVVTAAAATFGSELVTEENGDFYTSDYAILAFDEPFAALQAVTDIASINAMQDVDGILRHAIWQLDLPDGRQIPSFHRQIYTRFMQATGGEATSVPATDARHRWYVPLSSAPGAYDEGLSVADLVNGEFDPEWLRDRIVLIGPYAAGLQDAYPTAIDHATLMNGIEYQANAIATLLDGNLKREIPAAPQLVLLFLVTLAAALWLPGRRVLPSTLVWLGGCVAWVAACLLAWRAGLVADVLYIPLALSVCFVVSVAANYISAALEKRRITGTFERYVAPEIVAELLREDSTSLALGGKLTDIAVLFVDIRGFTTMSEGLDPPTVVEIVNRYLTLTSQCIFQNSGTLDKYVGDCTMAFWGAPLPQEDCIYKAVKAALDMVEGAKALSVELERQYGRTVGFGIGVHYGAAVVGNIGSPRRMDYTAIGDTVNTAARLESNAPAGQILVSRAVADALEGRVRFTSLGDSIRLKGKAEGFEILSVDGLVAPDDAGGENG